MIRRRFVLLAGLVALNAPAALHAANPPAGPAYQIVLRSRHAEATPTRSKEAQTGGGTVLVEQPEPNTIVATLSGSAAAGSECWGGAAGITLELEQCFDILPLRQGARPPRVGMVARVMGTLQVTDPGKCGKSCGTADQGPATACLTYADASLLSVAIKPSAVSCGQEVAINHRDGPVEAVSGAGAYKLTGSFRIGVSQGKAVFNRQYAVADFDPAPQLDAGWADALRPFRAVPRRDFGFKVVVRVIEDAGTDDPAPTK